MKIKHTNFPSLHRSVKPKGGLFCSDGSEGPGFLGARTKTQGYVISPSHRVNFPFRVEGAKDDAGETCSGVAQHPGEGADHL